MYQRYFVLIILMASMFILPTPLTMTTPVLSANNSDISLIETQLKMAISNDDGQGVSAILEFENQLTPTEIHLAESTGVEFTRRGSSIVNVGRIYSVIVHDEESLEQLSGLGLIRATSGSKQFVPSLTSSVDAIHANDVWNNLEVDHQTVDGSGVLVAVIDTGTSWLHPSFWRVYPAEFDFISQGPNYYLDLNDNGIPDDNEGPIKTVDGGMTGSFFNYASDYMFISTDGDNNFDYADGDRWIGGIDADDNNLIDLGSESGVIMNISKVAILYDQFSSNVYVRDVNLTDAIAIGDSHSTFHGTHVASTIAGGQIGFTSYVGVAPGADLLVIRSPLNSVDILDGVNFAIENDADIINMSFSSYLGFLDGTDSEDLIVTEAFLNYGILTTAAAGNLGNIDKHARFAVPVSGSNAALLDIYHLPDLNPYLSLLWQSTDRDEHVILNPPAGAPIDLGKFSDIAGSSFVLDTDNLSAYVFCEISPRGMNNIIIQLSQEDHFWTDGNWAVTVTNPEGEDIWVDGYAWDGKWETNFMTWGNCTSSLRTISSPATSDFAIAVACYDESSNSIYSTSSKGPRIDGAPKPNVAAPGVSITAAWGNFLSDDILWTVKVGTSMASPHVAGALALIRQAEGDTNPWMQYSALIDGAGGIANHHDHPLSDWGYGLIDAGLSVMYVLNESIEAGSTLSDWSLLPTFVSDIDEPEVNPDLDIRYVKVFQQEHSFGFAINLDAAGTFTTSNMLSIQWDIDSNALTGINGADLLVNITNSVLSIYEWNGIMYDLSNLTGQWWQSSTATFLRIDGLTEGLRGSLVVSTHNSTVANVDSTAPTNLTDDWRPMVESVLFEFNGDLTISVDTFDSDSGVNTRSIGASIIDGRFVILQSSIEADSSSSEIIVDSSLVLSEYVNSLDFNVTSESKSIFLPLVMLFISSSDRVRITNAFIDSSLVRVGLLFSETITGQFTVEGYELVNLATVCFRHSSGIWFNFTISGIDGLYEFVVSPSAFPVGDYDVFAIAKGSTISTTQLQFATLTIIEDNTLIIVGISVAVAALIAIYAFRRFSNRRGAL